MSASFSFLTPQDVFLFTHGEHPSLYEKLGAHPHQHKTQKGVRFAVWAPGVQRVYVVGSFNDYRPTAHPLVCTYPKEGLWEGFIAEAAPKDTYQFRLVRENVTLPLKSDPFCFQTAAGDPSLSVIVAPSRFVWEDESYLKQRPLYKNRAHDPAPPLSIYEVHLESWLSLSGSPYPSYSRIAAHLIPYARDMGFTHIEILPIAEYPFGGSWGYQPTSLFAPTSRFGDPDGLRFLVNEAHKAGLGVIMDWVSGHFPADAYGLSLFDGTTLFEYNDPQKRHHPKWHTLVYDYAKPQVRNFLISAALYWLKQFHIDGLRVDAVSSILYLDYERGDGQWKPNVFGGSENLEGIRFLHQLHDMIRRWAAGTFTVAEESSSWDGVTHALEEGGLGFTFKWNIGWVNDTQRYLKAPASRRAEQHQDMTFSLWYAHHEQFCLPLSHDELSIQQNSFLGKIWARNGFEKRATLRAYYGFFFAHPGAKLLFMGAEWAYPASWSHTDPLFQLTEDSAQAFQSQLESLEAAEKGFLGMIRTLNHLYKEHKPLHALDTAPRGFLWTHVHDSQDNLFVFIRYGGEGEAPILVIVNFSTRLYQNKTIRTPHTGVWEVLFNSDETAFGGRGLDLGGRSEENERPTLLFRSAESQSFLPAGSSIQQAENHMYHSLLNLNIPPLTTLYLRLREEDSAPKDDHSD